jgi:hypothetical protein
MSYFKKYFNWLSFTDIGILAVCGLMIGVYPKLEPSIKLVPGSIAITEIGINRLGGALMRIDVELKNNSIKPGYIDSVSLMTDILNPQISTFRNEFTTEVIQINRKSIGRFSKQKISIDLIIWFENVEYFRNKKEQDFLKVRLIDNYKNFVYYQRSNAIAEIKVSLRGVARTFPVEKKTIDE